MGATASRDDRVPSTVGGLRTGLVVVKEECISLRAGGVSRASLGKCLRRRGLQRSPLLTTRWRGECKVNGISRLYAPSLSQLQLHVGVIVTWPSFHPHLPYMAQPVLNLVICIGYAFTLHLQPVHLLPHRCHRAYITPILPPLVRCPPVDLQLSSLASSEHDHPPRSYGILKRSSTVYYGRERSLRQLTVPYSRRPATVVTHVSGPCQCHFPCIRLCPGRASLTSVGSGSGRSFSCSKKHIHVQVDFPW